MSNAVVVENVTKIYKTYKKPSDKLKEIILFGNVKFHNSFHALKEISFNIEKGTTVGIIGKNGSGKSTLLKIILGSLSPSVGKVEVSGKIASLLELGAGFNPELTGHENVFLYGSIMGLSKREIEQKYKEIIEFADIGDFINQPVKTYSSGMFVRLAFSSAVHCEPEIMIIDEALSVGDLYFQQKSMRKIRELKESGKTILFVSHDVQAVITLCDKVVWLEKGELVEIGDPKTVAKLYQMSIHDLQKQKKELKSNNISLSQIDQYKKIVNIDKRFGDGSAEIVGLDVLINDESVDSIENGDEVVIRTTIKIKEDLNLPIVGFTVRDRLSNIVFSSNTNLEENYLLDMKQSEMITLDFKFSWPLLQPGNYSISPAIANGTQENHIMCDWIENALIVTSFSSKEVIGLVGINSVQIDTYKLGEE